jgi:mono/diheme cytochrome c family protein
MKKYLKWLGILLVAILAIAAIAVFYLKSKFENLDGRKFEPTVTAITVPSDSASIERGKVLAVDCKHCHGDDYAGKAFFNDPKIGFMASANISGAKGSATEKYTDQDWVRTLRHGVNPSHRALMVMPAENIGLLGDQDLGCLIAYMKTVKPVEKIKGPTDFKLFGKVLAGAGAFGSLYPYDVIKHDQVQHITAPIKSPQPEYGNYLTQFHGCRGCHGSQLNGGKHPAPSAPPVPNITGGGHPGKWSLAEFKSTLRNGKTPEGKTLDAEYMPFPGIGAHDDIELEAIYSYLKSIPALPNSPELDKLLKK